MNMMKHPFWSKPLTTRCDFFLLCFKPAREAPLQEWLGGRDGGRREAGKGMYRYLEKGLLQEWLGGRDSGRREAGKGMYKYLEKGSLQE